MRGDYGPIILASIQREARILRQWAIEHGAWTRARGIFWAALVTTSSEGDTRDYLGMLERMRRE